MMDKTYQVYFETKNLGLYKAIPGLEETMQSELVRIYNIYANRTNGGITDKLNDEFNRLNPNYFKEKEKEGKEWYDLKEYNQFMADGYMSLVVDELNKDNASPILDFYVDPNEIVFTGCLKVDHSVTINFYIKEV